LQAPHPPQRKTAQKTKNWAKQALKKIWAINGFFLGQSENVGQPVK